MQTRKKSQPPKGNKPPLRFEANLRKIARTVAVNEQGRLIGEGHPRARFTDSEVDRLREMHEEFPVGHPSHLGYRRLAKMWDMSRSEVRDICRYKYRAQTPAGHKRRGG